MQQFRETPGQPPKAGSVGYTISDQVETQELDGNGRPVRGVRVHYQLQGGPMGSVFIPEAQYTVANVQAAVAAAAGTKAQVQRLTG